MEMLTLRQAMFPYGMKKNSEGHWELFNRKYKKLCVLQKDTQNLLEIDGEIVVGAITKAKLKKLDIMETGEEDTIYFYNDNTKPNSSPENMRNYLDKLSILLNI